MKLLLLWESLTAGSQCHAIQNKSKSKCFKSKIWKKKEGKYAKLNLLKRSSFLPRKIILPSVSDALSIWGSFTNKDGFLALESLLIHELFI